MWEYVAFICRKMRNAKEDDSGHGIDQEIIAVGLRIRNTEGLLPD